MLKSHGVVEEEDEEVVEEDCVPPKIRREWAPHLQGAGSVKHKPEPVPLKKLETILETIDSLNLKPIELEEAIDEMLDIEEALIQEYEEEEEDVDVHPSVPLIKDQDGENACLMFAKHLSGCFEQIETLRGIKQEQEIEEAEEDVDVHQIEEVVGEGCGIDYSTLRPMNQEKIDLLAKLDKKPTKPRRKRRKADDIMLAEADGIIPKHLKKLRNR